MTLGVWLVPLVLLAAIVLLWASAWFEGHVAPLERNPQLRALEAIETVIADTPTDNTALGVDDLPVAGPRRSAA